MAQSLELTDPTHTPQPDPGPLTRLALRLIRDERDLPFVRLSALLSLTLLPFAVYLFVDFSWWLALPYLAVELFFLGPFILMLHNTSHRRLFKKKHDRLNLYIPWVLGPLFGETPDTYFVHHVGMHHPENNLDDDLSSTMRYDRDSLAGFLAYFARFFALGILDLGRYQAARGRRKLLRRMLVGELSFYLLVTALAALVDWRAALVVFVIPLVTTRFLMMAGNWAQHAFIDPDDPGNCYRNSITCINTRYNHTCFNDGYHISHHLKASRHWTEHPGELLDNLDAYAREDAIIFEGIDFNGVWFWLMLGRHDKLADRFVELRDTPRSREEVIALLRARTRRVPETHEASATA